MRPTIIVPVYGRADEVRACVNSVLRHADQTRVPFDLLVIDDASPDDEVGSVLAGLDGSAPGISIEVLHNVKNLGFVGTVNRGLRQTSSDVVLLNSDTIVTAGWLDRMAAAAAEPDVATVTPLTNEGSICTLPPDLIEAFDRSGGPPPVDEIAAFVAASSLHLRPEVITGVGFCLYVTRRALDLVGELDEEAFGRGYGEEVDFCLRATEHGLRHVVDDATFVFHHGGASFGVDSTAAKAQGSALLHERHPGFRAANAAERRRDPLRPVVAALRLALAPRDERRPHVLHVLHTPSPYGGTEKHLDELIDSLSSTFDASIFTPSDRGFVLRTRWVTGRGPTRHEFLLAGAPAPLDTIVDDRAAEVLATVLQLFHFDAVHIHNLIGHSLAPLDVLASFAGPVVCTVHDYYLACPHHWLLYRNEVACGIPDDMSVCATCLPETRDLPVEFLSEFRADVARRLDAIDHWVFPSTSAADQIRSLYEIDEQRVDVIPHGAVIEVDPARRTVDEHHVMHDPLRVAFVGRGWAKKGLDVANRLADDLRHSAIEIHHFGEPKERASDQLVQHGSYDNRRLPGLLRDAGMHIVLLPGPYAETFGLVMTEALAAGLPVMGTAYGAIGERLRDDQVGWTLDPSDPDATRSLIESLDACRFELLRATRRAARSPIVTVAETAPAYGALYGSPSPEPTPRSGRGATG